MTDDVHLSAEENPEEGYIDVRADGVPVASVDTMSDDADVRVRTWDPCHEGAEPQMDVAATYDAPERRHRIMWADEDPDADVAHRCADCGGPIFYGEWHVRRKNEDDRVPDGTVSRSVMGDFDPEEEHVCPDCTDRDLTEYQEEVR